MRILERLAMRDRQGGALGRHSVMLASLVLMFIALPMLEFAPGGGLRFPILLCIVLLAATYVNRTQRWILWAAVILGVGTIAGLAIAHGSGSGGVRIIAELLGLGLLGFTTLVLLNSLVQARDVEVDTGRRHLRLLPHRPVLCARLPIAGRRLSRRLRLGR